MPQANTRFMTMPLVHALLPPPPHPRTPFTSNVHETRYTHVPMIHTTIVTPCPSISSCNLYLKHCIFLSISRLLVSFTRRKSSLIPIYSFNYRSSSLCMLFLSISSFVPTSFGIHCAYIILKALSRLFRCFFPRPLRPLLQNLTIWRSVYNVHS